VAIGHTQRALSCFILVLSWSRAVYARFALEQALESFLRGHVGAFAALQGVPRILFCEYVARVTVVCLCPTAIMRRRREKMRAGVRGRAGLET